jgi:dienelactone hydrolase
MPDVADVLLFHHARGLTPGVREFADELRAAGHRVVAPDLFAGRVFDSLADGVAHAEQMGFTAIAERGSAHADGFDDRFVTLGFSLGVLPAQRLAQTHAGVAGAVLCHAAVPPTAFGEGWPAGVALQMHLGADDEWAREDLEVARELAADVDGAELFVYPGRGHLVADAGSEDHDPVIAEQILVRVLTFLDAVGGDGSSP